MILHYLKWPMLFVLCFILQTSFVPSIAFFGVKPDLLMIILFFFSIRYGVLPGIFMGFVLGLTQDLYTPAILGQNALTKTIILESVMYWSRTLRHSHAASFASVQCSGV